MVGLRHAGRLRGGTIVARDYERETSSPEAVSPAQSASSGGSSCDDTGEGRSRKQAFKLAGLQRHLNIMQKRALSVSGLVSKAHKAQLSHLTFGGHAATRRSAPSRTL